jgi:hypothetical protein
VDYQFCVSFPSFLADRKVEKVCVTVTPLKPLEQVAETGWKKTPAPIPVRLHVHGALVSPAEHLMDLSPFGPVEVVYHITALARGSLPDAHLEVKHADRVEKIAIPLAARPARSNYWLLLAMIFIPLLLFIPSRWPELAVQDHVQSWLPSIPQVSSLVARVLHTGYGFLAHQGAQYSLSFWSLILLALALVARKYTGRVRQLSVTGSVFCLNPVAKTSTPPPFLTPVSDTELAEIHGRR